MLIITPSDFSLAPAAGATAALAWATSANGQQVSDHGTCGASLLPTDDDVVLVLPVRAVSWHRLTVPKVAASRLRAVLDGLLEERVLADTTELHFALEPGGRAGQTGVGRRLPENLAAELAAGTGDRRQARLTHRARPLAHLRGGW